MNQSIVDHTKFITCWIGMLSALSLGLGAFLIYKGFESGGVLIGAGGNGLVGLVGFLGGQKLQPKSPAVNVEPPSTVTVNQPAEPTP